MLLLLRLMTGSHTRILRQHGETKTADVDERVDVIGCESMIFSNISKLLNKWKRWTTY